MGSKLFLLTPPRGGATIPLFRVSAALLYFYSRPREGGRLHRALLSSKHLDDFYSRPREGGRPAEHREIDLTPYYNFYSRPREGGRLIAELEKLAEKLFLLTPPRGGRLDMMDFDRKQFVNFYSRPREGGRLLTGCGLYHLFTISTHAPARGGDEFPKEH